MAAGVCPCMCMYVCMYVCMEISENFLFYDVIATGLLPKGWIIIILVVSETSSDWLAHETILLQLR